METQFTYCILSYVHSQFLNEQINIGILFHFKSTNEVVFRRPKSFKRIKDLYPSFSEWQVKASFNALQQKVNRINNSINSFFVIDNIEKIIEELLREDATVFKFSEIKNAVIFNNDIDSIIEDYYNLYFSNYEEIKFKREKHNEEFILKNFKQRLFQKNANSQNLLYKDVNITSAKTTVKFDYKWQNGVENLIKTVGFDLEEENSINHKAILTYGQLNFIANEINNNDYNIALLVSAPSNPENSELMSAYNQAMEILNSAAVSNKVIIEESGMENYVEIVASQIKPLRKDQ